MKTKQQSSFINAKESSHSATELLNGGSQPPKKKSVDRVLIMSILPYSAMKSIANSIDEYSTL